MTVIVPDLNEVGRVGNQMWRAAAALGVATAHGEDLLLPENWDYRPWFSIPDEFYGPQVGTHVQEFVSHLDERALPYLQDLQLLRPAEPTIREWFTPSPDAQAILSRHSWLDELPRPRLSLHVRRGDFVTHHFGGHPLRSMDYYRHALELVPEAATVVVFSDDIPWCQAHLPTELGLSLHFCADGLTRPPEYADRAAFGASPSLDWVELQLMATLERHIISNSTYAWWGAYLSDDPAPIRPTNWFGWQIREHTDAELMFDDRWVTVEDPTQGGVTRESGTWR